MLASELITRSLRLINVPGRGAQLSSLDLDDGLEALQEILDSEAVSKAFVPGINRHFFPMVSGKAIYSYGDSPQADLRSDDFDDDPAPIKIEGCYIRNGSTITNNELVDEYKFENIGTWAVDADPDANIKNNEYVVEQPLGVTSTTQPITSSALVAGNTYTLRISVQVTTGTVEIRLRDSAVTFETFILDAVGDYEFDFVWPTTVAPDVEIATLLATDDIKVYSLSIVERGKGRLELPDGIGSDYLVKTVDQGRYNRRFAKGTGGRPYQLLYSRNYPLSEIRFDNSAVAGDILVMDVLVNRVAVSSLGSVIRMQPQARKWIRYALADVLAGEYGKSLNANQLRIMSDAWTKLSSGNRRLNTMGVDAGLRNKPTYNINSDW